MAICLFSASTEKEVTDCIALGAAIDQRRDGNTPLLMAAAGELASRSRSYCGFFCALLGRGPFTGTLTVCSCSRGAIFGRCGAAQVRRRPHPHDTRGCDRARNRRVRGAQRVRGTVARGGTVWVLGAGVHAATEECGAVEWSPKKKPGASFRGFDWPITNDSRDTLGAFETKEERFGANLSLLAFVEQCIRLGSLQLHLSTPKPQSGLRSYTKIRALSGLLPAWGRHRSGALNLGIWKYVIITNSTTVGPIPLTR